MPQGLKGKEMENVIGQMMEDMSSPPAGAALRDYGIVEVEAAISPDKFSAVAKAGDAAMTAVDGGSAVLLDAGSFIIAGVRVGSASYSGKGRVPAAEPEPHLLYLSACDLGNAYSIFFRKAVGTEPPDQPRGLEEALGRIRALLEWQHLERVVSETGAPGAVVAFDGALWAGIKGMGPMLERIVEDAAGKGVVLCGISKKSMLTHMSRPLIPAVQMAGEAAMPGRPWHYPVMAAGQGERLFGDIHVAKLHPSSRFAFRADLALPPGVGAPEAFAKLAYYADDPTYTGYPYPLARVHNDVAYSRLEVEDLRRMLRSEALKKGMGQAEWQMTFQDFHDVLDGNR